MEGVAGETAIKVRGALAPLTVRVAEAPKVPEWAVTVATPVAMPVATPAALTEAILVSEELHVTEEVRSLVDPSEYVPIA
jgi:hypothetical protein